MSLKQKFFDVYTKYYKKSNELDKMIEIADNYAIEFAQWVQFHSELWIKYKTSELLEIFKKEKGL